MREFKIILILFCAKLTKKHKWIVKDTVKREGEMIWKLMEVNMMNNFYLGTIHINNDY